MRVGVCIVNYGDEDLLKNCLKSIEDERKEVKDHFDVKVFDCNKDNVGFTRANNILINEHINLEPNIPSWIWLLNNDTTVEHPTLSAIHRVVKELDSKVGVLGFKICSMDDPDLIHHAGTGDCFPAGVHKAGSRKLRQFTTSSYEKWVTFASVLIRTQAIREVGYLDERMFNFFSDSDYCYRARYAGWRIMYHPDLVVQHKIGQSQFPSAASTRIMETDSIAFQNKWLSGKTFFDLDKELV